jgi:alpha-L-rhamnosidase
MLVVMALFTYFGLSAAGWADTNAEMSGGIAPERLRCEYLTDPVGIGTARPRLSWQLAPGARGYRQSAYRLIVASDKALLADNPGDLWDTGKVDSRRTSQIVYSGTPLVTGQTCYWKVKIWDGSGKMSDWSQPAQWSTGLLEEDDWQAEFISFRDRSPVHKSKEELYLPPARYYRKEFRTPAGIKRATIHATALGIYDLYLNGQRVSDRYFAPGWSDYRKRAYYHSYDVTELLVSNDNAIGAIVADGWYAGYVGYGVLVGYGPYKSGRSFYGKTPAFMAQLEIEYEDGKRRTIVTDASWTVTGDGPIREADIQGGETYDARKEMPGWSKTGFDDSRWDNAVLAEDNGSFIAPYFDKGGDRFVELGFVRPGKLQAYSAPPIVITQELAARKVTELKSGVHIFDLGENFAGVVRLRTKGPAGAKVTLRYGEMLHSDGRLMTENLRKARVIDHYILKGDSDGEEWTPRFTYHGFQFVEVTGLPHKPSLDTLAGLVLHNDTSMTSNFECSDPMINQLFKNITRTQRANFVEVPTDCPQRDERMGWMGDAQIYVRSATINADVASFFTKWLDDLEEAQRSFGAYPDYAPYPMQHGGSGKSFGTAWMDAGIICPWTIWKVYGDTRVIERHYASMIRFMEFRRAVSPNFGGISMGNTWGDWLNVDDPTPIEYIDACYFAWTSQLMAEMAEAIGKETDATFYMDLYTKIKAAFARDYLAKDGAISVKSQTAHVLALAFNLLTEKQQRIASDTLATQIAQNGFRMATGFLGTKEILPVLSSHGHHDLAVRLFQSRDFPSWGYEVVNGATSIWERWDSYTKEDGFGRHNAAMNSFSHYAFGAVCEWMFRTLAGIDNGDAGFNHIILRPLPPAPESNPDNVPIHWFKAHYDSINGRIASAWRLENGTFTYDVTVPPNTTASVYLPAASLNEVTESGKPAKGLSFIKNRPVKGNPVVLDVGHGTYSFRCRYTN